MGKWAVSCMWRGRSSMPLVVAGLRDFYVGIELDMWPVLAAKEEYASRSRHEYRATEGSYGFALTLQTQDSILMVGRKYPT
jgi:hypothetical protein